MGELVDIKTLVMVSERKGVLDVVTPVEKETVEIDKVTKTLEIDDIIEVALVNAGAGVLNVKGVTEVPDELERVDAVVVGSALGVVVGVFEVIASVVN